MQVYEPSYEWYKQMGGGAGGGPRISAAACKLLNSTKGHLS